MWVVWGGGGKTRSLLLERPHVYTLGCSAMNGHEASVAQGGLQGRVGESAYETTR